MKYVEGSIPASLQRFDRASDDCRFAAAVALFGMLLRKSAYCGNGNRSMVMELARHALGADRGGYREEFLKMVKTLGKGKRQSLYFISR